MTEMYHMRGTLEVGLKAYLHPAYQHCTDEAQGSLVGIVGSLSKLFPWLTYFR